MLFRGAAFIADRLRCGVFAVVNAFKRVATETAREQRTDFRGAKIGFHVELDRVDLIEDSFLKPRVLEHLAVRSGSFFFVDDAFDPRIARDERRVWNV